MLNRKTEGSPKLPEKVFVRTPGGSIRLKVGSILYISSENHALIYHMRDHSSIRTVTARGPFREQVQEYLRYGFFVFAFKAQLVNVLNIAYIHNCEIVFTNGIRTVCSKTRRRELIRRFEHYCGKAAGIAGKCPGNGPETPCTKNGADYTKIVPDYTKPAVAESPRRLIQ